MKKIDNEFERLKKRNEMLEGLEDMMATFTEETLFDEDIEISIPSRVFNYLVYLTNGPSESKKYEGLEPLCLSVDGEYFNTIVNIERQEKLEVFTQNGKIVISVLK